MENSLELKYEKGLKAGEAKDLKKGLKEGIKEGVVVARREDILSNLNEIGTITQDIIEMVNEEYDIDTLKKWLRVSIIAETIEGFKSKIKH